MCNLFTGLSNVVLTHLLQPPLQLGQVPPYLRPLVVVLLVVLSAVVAGQGHLGAAAHGEGEEGGEEVG